MASRETNKIHDKEQTLHVPPCHGKYCVCIDKHSLCSHCIAKNTVNGLKERDRQQFWTPEVCTIVNVVRWVSCRSWHWFRDLTLFQDGPWRHTECSAVESCGSDRTASREMNDVPDVRVFTYFVSFTVSIFYFFTHVNVDTKAPIQLLGRVVRVSVPVWHLPPSHQTTNKTMN